MKPKCSFILLLFLLPEIFSSCKKDSNQTIDGQYLTTFTKIDLNLNDTTVTLKEPLFVTTHSHSDSITVSLYNGQYIHMKSTNDPNYYVYDGSGYSNVTSAVLQYFPSSDSIFYSGYSEYGEEKDSFAGRKSP